MQGILEELKKNIENLGLDTAKRDQLMSLTDSISNTFRESQRAFQYTCEAIAWKLKGTFLLELREILLSLSSLDFLDVHNIKFLLSKISFFRLPELDNTHVCSKEDIEQIYRTGFEKGWRAALQSRSEVPTISSGLDLDI